MRKKSKKVYNFVLDVVAQTLNADAITMGNGRWVIRVEGEVLVIRDLRSGHLNGGDNRFAFYPGKGQANVNKITA